MTVALTHGGSPGLKSSLRSSILSGKRPASRPQATLCLQCCQLGLEDPKERAQLSSGSRPQLPRVKSPQDRGGSPRKMLFVFDPPHSTLCQVPSIYQSL